LQQQVLSNIEQFKKNLLPGARQHITLSPSVRAWADEKPIRGAISL
jgi:hypothetical protein